MYSNVGRICCYLFSQKDVLNGILSAFSPGCILPHHFVPLLLLRRFSFSLLSLSLGSLLKCKNQLMERQKSVAGRESLREAPEANEVIEFIS